MGKNFDNISEQFRKYIIEIKFNNQSNFMLWGTDMVDEDEIDKILSFEGSILLFSSINQIQTYVKSNLKSIFDSENLHQWARKMRVRKPYATYDLDQLKSIISDEDFTINHFDKKKAFEFIDFYNLFGDYAHQTKDEEAHHLMQEKNTKLFFDFAYNSFFWKSNNQEQGAPELRKIKTTELFANYQRILNYFIGKFKLVD
ncbi:MAG: hypothetical protein ABIV51_00610 [Saprospiraceae bacterium]